MFGWWYALIVLWNLAGGIKHEYFNFNVFMGFLGRSIGKYLLIFRLGHWGSLN